MSILLTTPLTFAPGHGTPAEVYNEVMLVYFAADIIRKEMMLRTQYGNTVDGKWVPGKAELRTFHIENTPDELVNNEPVAGIAAFDIIAAAQTQLPTGALIYDELGIALYTHLMATVPEYAGTLQ